jgi:hypothetical protein
LDLVSNQGQQAWRRQIRHYLGPDLPIPAENAYHPGRAGAPPAPAPTDASPAVPVSPPPAEVGLVHFDRSMKHRGHRPQHGGSDVQQSPQHALALHATFPCNVGGTEPPELPSQQGAPLMAGQPQRQSRSPVVSTAGAPPLLAANHPGAHPSTARAPQPFCHATLVSNQVAEMGLYPKEMISCW